MKALIAIDNWKLSIFERRLTQAKYQYEKSKGLTDDTQFLTVETDDVEALKTVVLAANTEAANASKMRTVAYH